MAKVKIINIKSFTHDAVAYKGILSYEITVNKGTPLPDHDEGELYPRGMDNVGTRQGQFPVEGSIEHEDPLSALAILNAGKGTTVVVGQAQGSGADVTATISNNEFYELRSSGQRQQDGRNNLRSYAHSADGDTLPITIVQGGGGGTG